VAIASGALVGIVLLGTALAGRPAVQSSDDPCGLDKEYATNDAEAYRGMVFAVGNGSGPTRDAALAAARADAERGFLGPHGCLDKVPGSSGRCDAIRQNTIPWKGKAQQDARKLWTACASASIEQKELERLEQEALRFDADMKELARAIHAQSGSAPLSLMPPTWESGCSAGEEGAAVLGALRRGFAGLENRSKLRTNLADAGPEDRRVLVQLHAQREEVVVTASLVELRGCFTTPVHSLSFPGYLLNVAEGDAGNCAEDKVLGTFARGVCAPALNVRIDLDTNDGVVCQGQVVEPRLTVSAPSHVQVFAVDAQAKAQQVFPMEGGSDLVDGQISLGTFDAVYDREAGETRLVVLAVPKGERFGRTQGWQGWCEVPGGWSSELIPSNAASVPSTYTILPVWHPSCQEKATSHYEHETPPACSASRVLGQ